MSAVWVELTFCVYHARTMKLAVQTCSDIFYVMCLPSILKFISRIMSLLNETGIVLY